MRKKYSDIIKDKVKMIDVFSKLGVKTNYGNRAVCPIHNGDGYSMVYGIDSYHCFKCNSSGDVISFYSDYYNVSFVEALKMIDSDFNIGLYKKVSKELIEEGNRTRKTNLDKYKSMETYKKSFELKESNNVSCAIKYLTDIRNIGISVVLKFIKANIVGQDTNKNVIFKMIDGDGKVVGAELRGTYKNSLIKQIVAGSKCDYGVNYIIGVPQKLFVFESSIDMISFYEIYKKRLDNCILASMGGLKPKIIKNTITKYGITDENIFLCVDNDFAGKEFYSKFSENNPNCKRIIPNGDFKDWNEYLVSIKSKRG